MPGGERAQGTLLERGREGRKGAGRPLMAKVRQQTLTLERFRLLSEAQM